MRWLFTGTAILTCGVLIPINILYNREFPPKRRDILTSMTIRDVKGMRLYAHVTITYLITFLVIGLVWFHWREMVRLRQQWFRSPEYVKSFYARTLSVTHVPKKYQSDEGIKTILDGVKMPYPVTSVHINRKVGRLPELIEYHNQTVRELEAILVKYLKGGKIGKNRPTVKVGGTCGLGGVRKDAIDFYTYVLPFRIHGHRITNFFCSAKLKRTEAAVEEYRSQIHNAKAENYGFASLAAVPYAHIVAKKLSGKHPKGTTVELAPNPRDIVSVKIIFQNSFGSYIQQLWENMAKSDMAIARKKTVGWLWLTVVCFLSLIPLLPVATVANLDAVSLQFRTV